MVLGSAFEVMSPPPAKLRHNAPAGVMHMQDNVVIAVAQHLPRSPGDASGSDSNAHRSSRQHSVSAVRGASPACGPSSRDETVHRTAVLAREREVLPAGRTLRSMSSRAVLMKYASSRNETT
jgi:hypothetical protein